MYELLIKLINGVDYDKYTIEDLKEMRDILESLKEPTEEVRLRHLHEVGTKKCESLQKVGVKR